MGKEVISTDKLLSKAMLPVVRRRDILRARTLSREEKANIERGGADILAKTPSGQTVMLTRKELIEKYTYLNGHKISIAGWTSSKEFIVFREDNTDAVAAMIPINCTVDINGKKANDTSRNRGDYVVALVDASGNIDMNTVGILSAGLFRKMYYMPPHDVIARNRNGGEKTFYPNGARPEPEREKPNKINRDTMVQAQQQPQKPNLDPIPFSKTLNIPSEVFDFGDEEIYKEPSKKVDTSSLNMNIRKAPQQPVQQAPQETKEQSENKYLAVGRLIDQNGSLVGFIIQNQQGQTKNINLQQMAYLCKNKKISNVMIGIKADTGKMFFRGNNTRLDTIPSYPSNW